MATATLWDDTIRTVGYKGSYKKGTFGPGRYSVVYAVPAAVGYKFKRGTVEITQEHLDNQPCEIEIEPLGEDLKAQDMYDFREKWEFCSSTDLHEFFRAVLGYPSPIGSIPVPRGEAVEFVRRCCEVTAHNSPTLVEHCSATLAAAEELCQ